VALLGYAFPKRALYALLAIFALAAVLAVLLVRVTADRDPEAPPDADASARAKAAELSALAVRASAGDPTALAVLGAVSTRDRTPELWRALTHGHCQKPEGDRCLTTLREAVRAVPALKDDWQVLLDLHALALSQTNGPAALELAAESFGTSGADLIHDVANERGVAKSPLGQRARELLQEERVRRVMSPALAAAVRLSTALRAPRCNELKKLLTEVGGTFDQRAVSGLTRLSERRGCGLLGLGDCYACLRSGRELKAALDGAKDRPAPAFTPAPGPSAR
jgi:hypothetical protein